jgi:arsenate reductase
MAEGLLRALAPDRFDVRSAGAVATSVNQKAIEVMAEIGIDISHHRSKTVDEFAGQSFDHVVTVCGYSKNGSCPVFHGQAGKESHWPFDDPARFTGSDEEVSAAFRHIRDQIRDKVECFLRREARLSNEKTQRRK